MTFSIAAADPDSGAVGAAIASVFPAVGAVCPWVSEDVVVLSQAWDSGASYGRPALDMLGHDISLRAAAETLVSERAGGRGTQFHGVEVTGETYAYTGEKATEWAGHVTGENHTAAGNCLVGEAVVEALSEGFREADGPLSNRLLAALEAGEEAGGDARGDNLSAALLVHAPEPKLYHNLRVDEPGDPIAGLRSGYETAREYYEGETDDSEIVDAWGEDYPESVVDFRIRY